MIKHKLKRTLVGAASLILLLGSGSALAWSGNGNSNAGDKVTICHATGSSSNPYVMISPNANGVVNGHESHQDDADIIPPFDYNDHGAMKHFVGQNWDTNGQAIFNNGCKVPGGMGGGPQKDCDGDYDNSPASDCTPPQPQKDCDGDYDNSPSTDCTPPAPQKDCDGDYDNSPASDCATPQPQQDCDGDYDNSPATDCTTGGLGGGPTGGGTTTTTTTTSNTGQVLGASTTAATGGLGSAQITNLPQGSVNGGEGAASKTVNPVSFVGLLGSVISVGSGLALLNRRQS